METNNQQICARSRNRTLGCRIELLNTNYNVVDTIQGKIIGGSITLTNNSNDNSNFSRLSGSLDMILTNDLSIAYYKLDLRHLVRIIMKITDNISGISAEYNLGIAILNSPQITKGIDGNSKISISLNDLFSNYNGDFSGDLDHTVTLPSSSTSSLNLSQSLLSIALNADLMNLDASKVKFETNTFQIPYDITCESGSKITDLLKLLMDLYKGYELFFDQNGVLIYQKIKQYETDSPIQEFFNSPNIISYDRKDNSTNIRNVVTVLGAVQETANSVDIPYQYKATATEDRATCPISTVNIGIKRKVIKNDKNQSNETCLSEAQYNLLKYSNLAEVLELSILPDFRLVPNRVIIVEYSDDNLIIEKGRYLIDSVTFGLKPSDLSTVTCHKLYPTT
ncbi:hypothetical protein [Clostridium beijerinckii]|uniref:hypothetical protein n=1 Tax=Clostridium beijerinckii TaxID=1520 RepID=UPI00156E822C|nr:hypothetical protein [Clostridium beijerinckii]NRU52582.1 putative DNA binding CopG/RHH family protein [Clostridium beijerinckii]NYC68625.1 putative DNA binding CopG/RHH family protein [Clostridium beijerinckii]NYC91783.1 putative DNA binding CopG/RHH family protein [Clostridium beijerinckii]